MKKDSTLRLFPQSDEPNIYDCLENFNFEPLKKLTVILLTFLFFITPLAPTLADYNSTGTDSSIVAAPVPTTDSLVPAQSPDSVNPAPGQQNSIIVSPDPALNPASPTPAPAELNNPTDDSQTDTQTSPTPQANSFITPSAPSGVSADNLPQVNSYNPAHPDSSSGALINDFPITIPPGRNGMQPNLSLSYNSLEKSNANIFGYGWSISIPYIERLNKTGVDKFYTATSTDWYFNSSLSGELALVATSTVASSTVYTYGSRTENGDFLNYSYANSTWTVTDKHGTTYKFGTDTSGQQNDPNNSGNIYKWMLQEVRDTNSNYVKYQYSKNSGQIYPFIITYSGNGVSDGPFTVNFATTTRADLITTYNTGFAVTTKYLLNQIQAKISGSVAYQYDLAYASGTNSNRSVLLTITQSGKDSSGNTTTLPVMKFTSKVISTNQTPSSSTAALPNDVYPMYADFVDLNGDGLTDIVDSIGTSTPIQKVYLNNGAGGWTVSGTYTPPAYLYNTFGGITTTPHFFADVNGDGLQDIITAGSNVGGCGSVCTPLVAYLNTGSNWDYGSYWTLPYPATVSLGLFINSGFVQDVNGDGLPDVIDTDAKVYLNNGSGWNSTSIPWNLSLAGSLFQRANTIVADINGDGIADEMVSFTRDFNPGTGDTSTTTMQAWLGDGGGNFYLSASFTPPTIFEYDHDDWGAGGLPCSPPESCEYDLGVRLIDINGDGLPDLVQSGDNLSENLSNLHTLSSEKRVYINTGSGWASPVNFTNGNPPAFDESWGYSGVKNDFGDFDGDGNTDVIASFGIINTSSQNDATIYSFNTNITLADSITLINYPTGSRVSVTYKPTPAFKDGSGNLLNPKLPFNTSVVSALAVNDTTANATSTESYSYSGGGYFYGNSIDRKLGGFNEIDKADPAGNVTKNFYHTGSGTDSSHGEYQDGYYKIGKLYRKEQYDNSTSLYTRIINKWDVSTTTPLVGFVKVGQTVESNYDGGSSHKDKATSFAYNSANGNQTQKIEYGEVNSSDDGTFSDTGTDDFTTSYSYASSSTSTVMSLLSDLSTTDHSAAKVKETRYYYDNQALGVLTNGNQTKKEDWKVSSTYVNSQKTYNGYGLITQDQDPRGKQTNYSYDANNLYPATVINPLSQVTNYTYNYSNGKTATTTDVNGNIFSNSYDGLGRLLQVSQPNPTTTSTIVSKIGYSYTDSIGNINVHQVDYMDATNTIDTYTYYDSLQRPIQIRKSSETNNYETKDQSYDNLGLLYQESLPYFSSGSASTTATSTAALYTTYGYDALERAITEVNAIGTIYNTYSPWQVKVTDLRNKDKIYNYDAYKNLVQVDEKFTVPGSAADTELYSTAMYSDSGLVSYYRFENNSNDSKGGNNGSASGVTYTTTGSKFNKGASFSSGKIDLGTSSTLNFSGAFTVSGWVNIPQPGVGNAYYLIDRWTYGTGNYRQWDLTVDHSGNLDFNISNNGQDSGATIITGNFSGYWNTPTLITATWDGSVMSLYFNRASAASGSKSSMVSTSGQHTYIGAGDDGTVFPMAGLWDDLALFSRSLNSTEVANLYLTSATTTTFSTLYAYDGNNNLTKITDAQGNIRDFTYDGLSRRTASEDSHASGDGTFGSYSYTYDDSNNLTQKVDPKSQTINYTYDDVNRPLTEDYTGTGGNEVIYTYDTCTQGKGHLCTSSSTAVTILNAYNALGQLTNATSTINSTAYANSYTYDRLGNKLTITNPDSSKIQYTYNSGGRAETVQRKESTDGSYQDLVTNLDYGPTGQITLQTNANCTQTQNTYDASHIYRLTNKYTINSCALEQMGMSLIGNSDLEESQSSSNFYSGATSTSDTLLPPPTKPIATSTPINASSTEETSSTTQLSVNTQSKGFFQNIFSSIFDGIKNATDFVVAQFVPQTAQAASLELYHTPLYDDANIVSYYRLEDTADSKGSHSLSNHSSALFNPSQFNNGADQGTSNTTKYLDTSSNMGINGSAISISSWVKIKTPPSSGGEHYLLSQSNTTNNVTNLVTYQNVSGTMKLFFDREKIGVSGQNFLYAIDLGTSVYHHIVYTYDGTTVHGYVDGTDVGSIAASGSGSSSGTNNFSIGASWLGTQQSSVIFDDVAVFNRALSAGEVSSLYTGSWPGIQNISYTYDSNGNITQITDNSATDASKTVTYSYDDLNRLTQASSTGAVYGGDYTYSYTYDALGNILSRIENGTTTTYTYATGTAAYLNPDAVATSTVSTSTSFTYDNNGNLTSTKYGTSTASSFTWDYNNRLTNATTTGIVSSYAYDPTGQRVKQTVGATTTIYSSKFYSTDGTTPTKHIYLPDGTLVATVTGTGISSAVSYVHVDHLGGANVVTDSGGAVSEIFDALPYGGTRLDEKSGSFSERFKFAQLERDDNGLDYARARYYNSSRGQFATQDPTVRDNPDKFLADPQQMNYYSYARNNPLINLDSTGLTTEINGKTGVVTNVINDNNTVIYAYPYLGDKRAAGPPHTVGNSARVDTFQVGATIHEGEDKTEDVYKTVVPQWEISPITAVKSMDGGKYDIKKTWGLNPADGYMYEGKYMTVQNLGDVLAGINAHAQGVSFDTFQRMAGAVQKQAGIVGVIKAFFGKEYGGAPLYGEKEVQYNASRYGYDTSYENFSKWWSIKH